MESRNKILTLYEAQFKPFSRLKSKACSARSSLTPNRSQRSLRLNFESLRSLESPSLSTSTTPVSFKPEPHKAISLIIIEKYFSDICRSISKKSFIEPSLLAKADTMGEVLKDCLVAVDNLSLEFYVLMTSSLKEIKEIYLTGNDELYTTLSKKMMKIASLLEDDKYTSESERVSILPAEEHLEDKEEDLTKELLIRMSRVNVRVLNIWRKILSPQREAAVICCCFLLLYCEVDPNLKISPGARIPIDSAINSMKVYISNPGYAVTTIRKTKDFIDSQRISPETFTRIQDLLSKLTAEQVRSADKTLSGLAIYELITFSLQYHQSQSKLHRALSFKPLPNRFSQRPRASLPISRSSHTLKTRSLSPSKSFQPRLAFVRKKPTSIDKNISAAKQLITTALPSANPKVSPIRARKSPEGFSPTSNKLSNHRDILEEMQYHQLIEERFRHFLIDKLHEGNSRLKNCGVKPQDLRLLNEKNAIQSRELWLNEFEKSMGAIRFNFANTLLDEKRYTAELIRAQRQLEIIEKFNT